MDIKQKRAISERTEKKQDGECRNRLFCASDLVVFLNQVNYQTWVQRYDLVKVMNFEGSNLEYRH